MPAFASLGSTNSGDDLKFHHVPKVGSDWWLFHGLQVHCSHTIASHFNLKVHFCTRCGHYGPPGGKSPGLKSRCKPPSKTGKQALRNIRKGRWPAYRGKAKKKVITASKLCLGRFAILFKQRRIRAAFRCSQCFDSEFVRDPSWHHPGGQRLSRRPLKGLIRLFKGPL